MKRMLSTWLMGMLLSGSCTALSAPIYRNVAAEVGLEATMDRVRVLKDSEDVNKLYVLPTRLSSAGRLFSELPVFLRPPLADRFDVIDWGDGLHEVYFYVVPDIGLSELLDAANTLVDAKEQGLYYVDSLSCYNPSLKIINVPSQLIERFEVLEGRRLLELGDDPFFSVLSRFVDPDQLIPGYLARYSLYTRNPDQVTELLRRHGAKGQSEFTCLGYTEQMNPATDAPTEIRTSIPISVSFR